MHLQTYDLRPNTNFRANSDSLAYGGQTNQWRTVLDLIYCLLVCSMVLISQLFVALVFAKSGPSWARLKWMDQFPRSAARPCLRVTSRITQNSVQTIKSNLQINKRLHTSSDSFETVMHIRLATFLRYPPSMALYSRKVYAWKPIRFPSWIRLFWLSVHVVTNLRTYVRHVDPRFLSSSK